jgi:5-methylcytosine-specific restriction endonuclease McrA
METTSKPINRTERNQGMNWIRQEKRLAIYLRDGLACAYCGDGIENGTQLSLDHLKPHSKGGQNHESNLVTCCCRCNSSRGNRSVRSFCRGVAEYLNHGIKPSDIEKHVRNCARRSLAEAKIEAKALVARRGSAARVLSAM